MKHKPSKRVLVIVDAAIEVTGAVLAAASQAKLLEDDVRTILVLPRGHRIPMGRLVAFSEVVTLPLQPLRKSITAMLRYLPALIASSWQLKVLMRNRGCNCLQLNDFNFLHGFMLRIMGFRGRIVTFVRLDPVRYGLLGALWLRASDYASNEIVAVSRFIQLRIAQRFKSHLIYAHVNDDRPPPRRLDATRPVFLFVGNYIEGKGQEDAIAAFHRIAGKHSSVRLRFIGSDMGLERNQAFRARLEHHARRGPNADRIEFEGPSNDLADAYRAGFAALNFSRSESFSMTCLEASFAGMPVIATRCGGPEEIIEDGETGFLVPIGNVAAMADRMAWLLDNPVEAEKMGQTGHSLVVTTFAPEVARELYLTMLNIDSQPKRRP